VFHRFPVNILTIINYFEEVPNQTFVDMRRLHYSMKQWWGWLYLM